MSHDQDPEIVAAVVACAATVFGEVSLVEWRPLVSSDRALVARVSLATSAGHRSLIAKVPGPAGSGGTREQAALEVLGGLDAPQVPRRRASPPGARSSMRSRRSRPWVLRRSTPPRRAPPVQRPP